MEILFNSRLRELRKEKALTQTQLAQILNVSQATVAKWETGDREPDLIMILRLCEVLETSVDYLLGVSDV
ncbi:helix-turn-helix transcriptional regulator [Pumilibacter muris]|uniref:helix-turn-helix transcriptional regulator n=1 Tax=Pumilibacter muris TaxID=2941510 RepID=UPI00203B7320|nr:helix-turn-helix transcriptional regulator [Pumilibacter muris]